MNDLNLSMVTGYNTALLDTSSSVSETTSATSTTTAAPVNTSASAPEASQASSSPTLDSTSAKPDMTGLDSVTSDDNLMDSMASIIKLLIQLGQLAWEMNIDDREAQVQSQVASINQQAEKMSDAAIVGLVMGVVFGAINLIGSAVSIGGASKSIGKQKSLNASGNWSESKQQLLSQQSGRRSAAGESLGAFGKVGESSGSAAQQIMQADAKTEEANQAKFQADMQRANDFVQNFSSMIRELRNLFAQINQDTNQTVRSIINKA